MGGSRRRRSGAHLALDMLFVLCTLTAIASVAVPLIPVAFGWRTMVVVSGSMEPEIGVGDALVIGRPAPDDIRIGEVITFQPFGAAELTTHRVIGIERIDGHLYLQTKGDANDTPDPNLADSDAVVGTIRMHVPHLGRLLHAAADPRVRLVTLGVPASIVMLQQLSYLRRRRRSSRGAPSPLIATTIAGRSRAVACWVAVLVIAIALIHASAGTGRSAAVVSNSASVGDNTFTTAAVFP